MGIVYLVQQLRVTLNRPPRDMAPVLRYGEVVTLLDTSDAPSVAFQPTRSKIMNRLANFDPENDYIVWIGGDPMGVVAVTSELLRRGITKFQWLRFTRKKDAQGKPTDAVDYLPMQVDLEKPPRELSRQAVS